MSIQVTIIWVHIQVRQKVTIDDNTMTYSIAGYPKFNTAEDFQTGNQTNVPEKTALQLKELFGVTTEQINALKAGSTDLPRARLTDTGAFEYITDAVNYTLKFTLMMVHSPMSEQRVPRLLS